MKMYKQERDQINFAYKSTNNFVIGIMFKHYEDKNIDWFVQTNFNEPKI